MNYFRTPDSCFEDLPDYAFEPNYVFVSDLEGGELRMHYLDEGPPDGEIILCLHGQPTWSFLYRQIVQSGKPTVGFEEPEWNGR